MCISCNWNGSRQKVFAVVRSILVFGVKTLYTALLCEGILKATQMNVPHSLIWELMFYEFKLGHSIVEGLWEPYPSYHNGLFSLLLVPEIFLPESRSISVLSEQYKTFYLFYVSLSFLCNVICYLISVFAFSLVTLSGTTTGRNQKRFVVWKVKVQLITEQ